MLIERGVISREFAPEIALRRLRFFRDSPQGPEPDATGYRGFYYHFLHMKTGRRVCGVRVVHDRLGLPVRRHAHLRCLFRRANRGRGGGPPVGGRALPPRGLAVGAERRRGAFPTAGGPKPGSFRTPGSAMTRRSWYTSRPRLAHVRPAVRELRRLLFHLSVEGDLWPRGSLLGAAIHTPALAPLDRFPRHP